MTRSTPDETADSVSPRPGVDADGGGSTSATRRPIGPPWSELDRGGRSARVAWLAFAMYIVVAFVLIRTNWGQGYWFVGDDWGMIVDRDISHFGDWFRPQNGHWSMLPTITYSILFKSVGLTSYWPYQTLTVVLHLTLAVLLRVVMRRAGVGPWVATIAAGTFVLFGTGVQNILWAIQVSMVGSLVFGLVHVLLADHDGPSDYRDGLGILAGAVALSASGVGALMVVMVGLSTLLRRGWKAAALHIVPLAVAFSAWYLLTDASSQSSGSGFGPLAAGDWVVTGWSGVFLALGEYELNAILLAAMLTTGMVLTVRRQGWSTFRGDAAVTMAMLVSAILLFVVLSTQRQGLNQLVLQSDTDFIRAGRYIAISLSLTLPGLALAANAIIRQWRFMAPLVLALFLIGVPANIRAMDEEHWPAVQQALKATLLAAAYSPVIEDVPGDVLPEPGELQGAEVPTDFLRTALANGKLPPPPTGLPDDRPPVGTRLRLSQTPYDTAVPDDMTCATYTEPRRIDGEFGDEFGFEGAIGVSSLRPEDEGLRPVGYNDFWSGQVLRVQVPLFSFKVRPAGGATEYTFCER